MSADNELVDRLRKVMNSPNDTPSWVRIASLNGAEALERAHEKIDELRYERDDATRWGQTQIRNCAEAIRAMCAALEDAAAWHDAQDKAISKQPKANIGDNGWRRNEHQEQAGLLRAAIAKAEGRE